MQHRDLLLCDLAETYGVTDFNELPVHMLAALAVGLPEDSRVMRRISGAKLSVQETLLAVIADGISTLVWLQTEDARRGANRPKSILAELTRDRSEDPETYDSGDAFLAALEKLTRGGAADGN